MDESLNFLDRGAHDWQDRLSYITGTMRELSTLSEPHAMVAAYSERMRALRMGRVLSLTRRGVTPPEFILARDSRWEDQPNPWRQRDQLPTLEGGILGELMYGNDVRLIQDFEVESDDPAAEILDDVRALVAIPIFDGGEALNVVVFTQKEPNSFDPEDLPQSVWMANLFGRLTHNLVLSDELRRANAMLDDELKTIADIQRALLPPELPKIPSLDLAAYYQPAALAGGDYYDFFPLQDGTWGILLADVSGHGSPAAVEMAITRTLAHVRAEQHTSPGSLLGFINDHLVSRIPLTRGAFVTAFAGVYDPSNLEMLYSSAGHHPPRVKRCSDDTLFGLEAGGSPPLGVIRGHEFGEAAIRLRAGDQMIAYTDGLTEAFNAGKEMFGQERLDRVLQKCGSEASELIERVLVALRDHTGDVELEDDITLVTAKVTG